MERPTNASVLAAAADRVVAEDVEAEVAHGHPSTRAIPNHRQYAVTTAAPRRRKKKQYVIFQLEWAAMLVSLRFILIA